GRAGRVGRGGEGRRGGGRASAGFELRGGCRRRSGHERDLHWGGGVRRGAGDRRGECLRPRAARRDVGPRGGRVCPAHGGAAGGVGPVSATDVGAGGARRVLLATRNAKKLAEVQRILDAALGGHRVQLVGLSDVPEYPEAPETGLTFAENALLKAREGCRHTGLPTVADDSGLAVDAL